ncbi:MAG: EAL domain-containing protein [Bacilli bacterium]|nr:EAL domain-containing protein [Bacilli bacterium]
MKGSRGKKTLGFALAFISLFVLGLVVYLILVFANVLKNLYINLFTFLVLLVLAVIGSILFAIYTNVRREERNSIAENEYSLHRKYRFFNIDAFSNALLIAGNSLKNRKGYMVAFTPIRSANIGSYSTAKVADFHGYIADFIKEKYHNASSGPIGKRVYYCFSRGVFLFYLTYDEANLNKFISELEDVSYQISQDKDFRMYIQPAFGIYEHEKGENDSVYDMTTKAIAARGVAEKNYESAIYFNTTMINSSSEEEADEILTALANGEFVVYYQPKFNLAAKRFTSAEALIRWNSPTRGILSPMKFINSAEHGGLIHKIDMYVFEQVCKDLDETRRKGRRLVPVSVNFSIYEFYAPNFVEDLISTVEKFNINPSLLEIEILEGTTGVNLFLSISILKKIKDFGIRILMDDFGVGYSNFQNLKNLPVDVLKIDKSFIDGIEEDVKTREITKFMIEFGKQIGLEVVAEGVDNAKQLEILKKFKCDTIQGFYYSQALPRQEFERFLATNTFEKKEAAVR